jgi:hypothetical protein
MQPSCLLRKCPSITPCVRVRQLSRSDVKPERLKLPDVPTDSFLGVPPIEVVGPKLLVGHAVAHDVERNLEDLMPHGHDRLLVPPVPRDPVISGLQGRAVLAHGPQPGLNQRGAQVPIAFVGFAAPALSRTFVLARTHGAPATQVARRAAGDHILATDTFLQLCSLRKFCTQVAAGGRDCRPANGPSIRGVGPAAAFSSNSKHPQ